MTKRIRVLQVIGQMNVGGAELRLLDLLKNVDRTQVRIDFCTLTDQAGDLETEIRSLGADIYPVPLGPKFYFGFRKLLQELRPGVVHSHMHYSSGLIMRLAAQERIPVRITHFRSSHDGKPQSFRRRFQRTVMRRWIDKYATDILAVSEGSMAASWTDNAGDGDSRCKVVYNGIDFRRFTDAALDDFAMKKALGFDKHHFLVIHVGRIAPPKNHSRLLDIFAAIRAKSPDAHLLLVGGGACAMEQQLRRQVETLGIDHSVHFLGQRSDIPALLAAADVMVFPSLWEGLPGAVIEACAAGVPVVASDLPGVEEIAEQFPNAITMLSLNVDVDEWANAAIRVASQPGLNRKGTMADQFGSTVFDMGKYLETLYAIWSGASR